MGVVCLPAIDCHAKVWRATTCGGQIDRHTQNTVLRCGVASCGGAKHPRDFTAYGNRQTYSLRPPTAFAHELLVLLQSCVTHRIATKAPSTRHMNYSSQGHLRFLLALRFIFNCCCANTPPTHRCRWTRWHVLGTVTVSMFKGNNFSSSKAVNKRHLMTNDKADHYCQFARARKRKRKCKGRS
jgi:hypothetical protein